MQPWFGVHAVMTSLFNIVGNKSIAGCTFWNSLVYGLISKLTCGVMRILTQKQHLNNVTHYNKHRWGLVYLLLQIFTGREGKMTGLAREGETSSPVMSICTCGDLTKCQDCSCCCWMDFMGRSLCLSTSSWCIQLAEGLMLKKLKVAAGLRKSAEKHPLTCKGFFSLSNHHHHLAIKGFPKM